MTTFGPDRIRIAAIPAGATLDVQTFVHRLVEDIVTSLAGDRFDDLVAVAQAEPVTDGHAPEQLLAEQLIASLVAEHETRLPIYGREVTELAAVLLAVAAPKSVTTQQDRRTA